MTSRFRVPAVLLGALCALSLVASSCSSSDDASDTTVVATVAETAAATEAPADTTAAPADTTAAASSVAAGGGGTGVLVSLENGDRACYVGLSTTDDHATADQQLPGSFELCEGGTLDATGMIGQQVTYRTERAPIAAASCEGAPDCAESEEVDLVVQITAAGSADGSTAASSEVASGTDPQIAGLALDSPAAAVIALLGEPASRSEVIEEGATGEFVSTWSWPAKGVEAKMAASTATGPQVLRALTISAPSELATTEGVRIGTPEADVRKIYGDRINTEDSQDGSIVVGSIYGGLIVTIANGVVSELFVGAAAE